MPELLARLGAPRGQQTASSVLRSGCWGVQPFSQKSRAATVPEVFQIGLCGVVEADLELFCNSWSAGLLRERLYVPMCQNVGKWASLLTAPLCTHHLIDVQRSDVWWVASLHSGSVEGHPAGPEAGCCPPSTGHAEPACLTGRAGLRRTSLHPSREERRLERTAGCEWAPSAPAAGGA